MDVTKHVEMIEKKKTGATRLVSYPFNLCSFLNPVFHTNMHTIFWRIEFPVIRGYMTCHKCLPPPPSVCANHDWSQLEHGEVS